MPSHSGAPSVLKIGRVRCVIIDGRTACSHYHNYSPPHPPALQRVGNVMTERHLRRGRRAREHRGCSQQPPWCVPSSPRGRSIWSIWSISRASPFSLKRTTVRRRRPWWEEGIRALVPPAGRQGAPGEGRGSRFQVDRHSRSGGRPIGARWQFEAKSSSGGAAARPERRGRCRAKAVRTPQRGRGLAGATARALLRRRCLAGAAAQTEERPRAGRRARR